MVFVPPLKDLTGMVSGRLTVLSRAAHSAKGEAYWLCRCSCPDATEKAIRSDAILNKRTRSCGCLSREARHQRKGANSPRFKHGHAEKNQMSPEFNSWRAMVYRCSNSNSTDYLHYAGRGISVCDRWRGKRGFENFLADVGPRPDGKTLDRWPDKN